MINVSLIVFVLDHLINHQEIDELYLTKINFLKNKKDL